MQMLKSLNRTIMAVWILTGVTIPVFSIFGRGWLQKVSAYLDAGELALVMGTALVAAAGACVMWLIRQKTVRAAWHGLWLALVIVSITQLLPNVVEWLHFILFGSFGFLAARIWYPLAAVLLCLLMSGFDELLQWALPDRVGDWRDLAINAAASLIGAVLAVIGDTRR